MLHPYGEEQALTEISEMHTICENKHSLEPKKSPHTGGFHGQRCIQVCMLLWANSTAQNMRSMERPAHLQVGGTARSSTHCSWKHTSNNRRATKDGNSS